jgi:hypothetical protein
VAEDGDADGGPGGMLEEEAAAHGLEMAEGGI